MMNRIKEGDSKGVKQGQNVEQRSLNYFISPSKVACGKTKTNPYQV